MRQPSRGKGLINIWSIPAQSLRKRQSIFFVGRQHRSELKVLKLEGEWQHRGLQEFEAFVWRYSELGVLLILRLTACLSCSLLIWPRNKGRLCLLCYNIKLCQSWKIEGLFNILCLLQLIMSVSHFHCRCFSSFWLGWSLAIIFVYFLIIWRLFSWFISWNVY